MIELSPQQRAAQTKRRTTRAAFITVADGVFQTHTYANINSAHLSMLAGKGEATFYQTFGSKRSWAIDVLEARLDETLDKKELAEGGISTTSYAKILGRLTLLEDVADNLPGITASIVEVRTSDRTPYEELLPRFYTGLIQAVEEGQDQRVFRSDLDAAQISSTAIDSLALACAVRSGISSPQSLSTSSLIVDGLMA